MKVYLAVTIECFKDNPLVNVEAIYKKALQAIGTAEKFAVPLRQQYIDFVMCMPNKSNNKKNMQMYKSCIETLFMDALRESHVSGIRPLARQYLHWAFFESNGQHANA